MQLPDPSSSALNTDWPAPLQALWWLKKGAFQLGTDWEQAHNICQMHEGDPDYDIVHALVHWVEGDNRNADYWFSSAQQTRQTQSVADEWNVVATRLSAKFGGAE